LVLSVLVFRLRRILKILKTPLPPKEKWRAQADGRPKYPTFIETPEYIAQLDLLADKYSAELLDAALTGVLWGFANNPEKYERVTAGIPGAKSRSFDATRLFNDLPRTTPMDVLLASDLHAGNVLRPEREPWLVIDPKPFVGDPAYDATQHLFNCEVRLRSDPRGRFAALRTCGAWIESAFKCGCLHGPRRNRGTIGKTAVQWRSRKH
jgi:Aminoglycoside/hydroxyurea antibiotic resistance kinase